MGEDAGIEALTVDGQEGDTNLVNSAYSTLDLEGLGIGSKLRYTERVSG
jgi:hypothetical protein